MTIDDIKTLLGVPLTQKINFEYLEEPDADGNRWVKHWDNDKRIAVMIPEDSFEALKLDKTIDLIDQQSTKKSGPKSKTPGVEYKLIVAFLGKNHAGSI